MSNNPVVHFEMLTRMPSDFRRSTNPPSGGR